MSGYYRFPTICQNTIVFVCEDDLWTVSIEGGIARRLTSNLGAASSPCLSPNGELLAFTGSEEGPPEVYVMPALGGEAKRLTYQGSNAAVVNWDGDGKHIFYSSGAGLAFNPLIPWIWKICAEGGEPQRLPSGPASHIDFGDTGGVILGRLTREPARWKRYRGGTAGQLWIDTQGDGQFQSLAPVDSNFTAPMWIGERIYFISDHEGVGNIYSCLPTGEDIQRHTHQDTYYCRSAKTDRTHIVYHAGADLFVYDIENDTDTRVDVEFRSPRIQKQRKFVSAMGYLREYALTPDGHALALTVRGKPFTMANWEGAVLQHGERTGTRYRFTKWLNDGKRLVTLSDAEGEEALEIHTRDGSADIVRLDALDIGHVRHLTVAPQTGDDKNDRLLLINNRLELLYVDLETQEMRVLDKSHYQSIQGATWSPDGEWCAYSFPSTETTRSIKLCKIETGETWLVTQPEFSDYAPAWDPDGKYLYFLSRREFTPIYDALHFDLGFPAATRPLLITLQKTLGNPFVPEPRPLDEEKEGKDKENEEEQDEGANEQSEKETKPITIDLDGISQRVVAFPYPRGHYGQIAGIEGKAIFTSFPSQDALDPSDDDSDTARGRLHAYDFKEQKKETLVSGINDFQLSRDLKTLVYAGGMRLRVIKAGKKAEGDSKSGPKGRPSRQNGWIDLSRVKASVIPTAEWHQMYREAWRLQRDYFWTEDMSGVDWEHVYQRYLPLLDRIATRGEFSDLMWEMQGELGTSHAYELGGDYRRSPNYAQGFLGADFTYDTESEGYRVTHIPQGDAWEATKDSPLNAPGINVRKGDVLLAIGGQRLSETVSPGELLVNLANQEVQATFQNADDGEKRVVTLKVLRSEGELRYREWVSGNRQYVHEKTDGKVGYLHIPDMMRRGYAEFHRGFLAEVSYPGLLVDVRCNRGGHVSQLLLEKLARRRIGYDIPRWGTPHSYPDASVLGPMVAVTDENAGSDGDIFSHCFKLMELGLLIGKRTWGGVIGISPHQSFVDGGRTTQPEYSFWFVDVGWRVENYGTDPDIEVDYRPQDYAAESDPQLDRAIEELLRQIEENPPEVPDFGDRPRLTLPTLPKP